MKKLFLTTAFLCCAMTIVATPVTPQTARQAAAKFLNKKGIALKNEAMRAKNRAMGSNTDCGEQTQASPYYVFCSTPQLSGKPTVKGVYIHQGKKVVMK